MLTRDVFDLSVSFGEDARAKNESMRAMCERAVAHFECDVCWTISTSRFTVSTRRVSGQPRDLVKLSVRR